MNKRFEFLVYLLMFSVLVAVVHSVFHFYVFGTGINGFFQQGVSGFSVGKFSVGEENSSGHEVNSSLSKVLVLFEWIIVLGLFVFVYTQSKTVFKRETAALEISKKSNNGKHKTSLDQLYELLQEKKKIRFVVIQKVFKVSPEIVNGWAKTLELGGLATIEYPRVGGPELVLLKDEDLGEKKR